MAGEEFIKTNDMVNALMDHVKTSPGYQYNSAEDRALWGRLEQVVSDAWSEARSEEGYRAAARSPANTWTSDMVKHRYVAKRVAARGLDGIGHTASSESVENVVRSALSYSKDGNRNVSAGEASDRRESEGDGG